MRIEITLRSEEFPWLYLDLVCCGDYVPERPDVRTQDCPMGYPGESAEISNLKVYMEKSNLKIDITGMLSESQLSKIEEEMIEFAEHD